MIHFNGSFQLGAVVKEDFATEGDKVVYFVAFSKRGKNNSDEVFCKVTGKTADVFIKNLIKRDDGSYKSRRMYLEGVLETYKKQKREVLPPKTIKPDDLDENLGKLFLPIAIVFERNVEEQKVVLKVNHLEFVDKKNEDEKLEIFQLENDQGKGQDLENNNDEYYDNEDSLYNTLNVASNNIKNQSINIPEMM